jgi:uncharacterized protein
VEPTAPSALPPDERLVSIDVLRGLALFGVLVVNVVTEFRVSIFQQFLPVVGQVPMAERVAAGFVSVVLQSKALALFSFLFGVGLAIQFDRLSDRGRPLYWLTRRLAVLLLFGVLHLLFIWNGDILTEYALAGFLVLPFLYTSKRVLAFGIVSLLTVYVAMPLLQLPIPWPTVPTLQQHAAEAERVYATGGLDEIWRFSLRELPLLLPLHIDVFPRTVALFLLGALVWRTGVLQHLGLYKREFASGALAGIAVGAALTVVADAGARLAPVILALAYGAAIVAVVQFPATCGVLSIFGPVGRMAFTNYVMQSLIFGYIFFGYGLGQFGQLGAAHVLLIGIAVYVAQTLLSALWLEHFRFGPLEWLWRTLTYGKVQQIRKPPSGRAPIV